MRNIFYSHPKMHIFSFLFFILSIPCSMAQSADSVLFRDDFDRSDLGSSWQVDASWDIRKGIAHNAIDGTGGYLRTTNYYNDSSYIIETSAKGFNSNYYREFRITFGQKDLSASTLYQVRYTAYGGGRLTLSRSIDNVYYPVILDEVAVYPVLKSDKFYSLRISKYKSGLIQVYLNRGKGYDSIPLLEAIDSNYQSMGHIGWQVDTQSFAEDFYVDWISASKPAQEKPAVKEKPVEDDLITQVSPKSGKPYKVSKLYEGSKELIDRDYTIVSLPDYLKGASFIQTANDDKKNKQADFLSFFVKKPCIVYIAYDPRSTAMPSWLSQWNKTGDRIGVSDSSVGYLEVYSRLIDQGQVYPFPVIIGGNLASPALGAKTNYIIAAVERPTYQTLQAEDALLSGVVAANNHINYTGTGFADFKNLTGDFIEWTFDVKVPGTYNLGFSFANASLEQRSLQLSDNGIYNSTLDFIPVSISWDSWAFLSGPQIFLTAGTHKIRLTATGTSGPNIDEMSLFYLSPSPFVTDVKPQLAARNPGNKMALIQDKTFKVFPNPFVQSTNIFYTLKEKAHVNLSVYNLQGQQLQTVENAVHLPGNYKAVINGQGFAKGIYLYKLQIGNEIKTGKLLKE